MYENTIHCWDNFLHLVDSLVDLCFAFRSHIKQIKKGWVLPPPNCWVSTARFRSGSGLSCALRVRHLILREAALFLHIFLFLYPFLSIKSVLIPVYRARCMNHPVGLHANNFFPYWKTHFLTLRQLHVHCLVLIVGSELSLLISVSLC